MAPPEVLQIVRLTPEGRGAVAVLLVVGEGAAELAGRHFVSESNVSLSSRALNRIYHGHWRAADGEDIVVCRRSATEVEIHCHGGRAAAERIIADLAADGCEDLPWRRWIERTEPNAIRAAALTQLAEARTERTAAILLDQFNGALDREIREIVSQIGSGRTKDALARIDLLIERSSLGLHLVEPWRVVLAGPPNVGKSSLINALVGYQRAIVFDQPGTTRDILTASAAFDGWPVELSDTAGLRASDDPLEAAGVELAKRQLAAADFIVLVTDCREPIDAELQKTIDFHRRTIIVGNKSDLLATGTARAEESNVRQLRHLTSAVTGLGVAELGKLIVGRLTGDVHIAPGDAVPFTTDQVQRLALLRDSIRGEFRSG